MELVESYEYRKMDMLKVQHIDFAYGHDLILNDLSFKLEKGRIYCFLGENGSGKSTLMKLLIGHLKQKRGEIFYKDKNIKSLSAKDIARIFSYVPQTDGTFFSFSVLEMVVMGRTPYLSFFDRPSKEDYRKAEQALELVEISHLKDKMYMELSGGQKQLVLIARAITQGASFLLLDEPTSHLDYYHQHQILKVLQTIVREQSISVLVNMHDPNLTIQFAEYVFMLKKGRIIHQGSVQKVMVGENLSELYGMKVQVNQLPNGKQVITGHL